MLPKKKALSLGANTHTRTHGWLALDEIGEIKF